MFSLIRIIPSTTQSHLSHLRLFWRHWPTRHPPVPPSQQAHRGRHEQRSDDRRIYQDSYRHTQTHFFGYNN